MMVVVVLDNVRSAHNVGSVLRTADSLGVESVVMCGITATPPSREIHKTALGAEFSVKWCYEASTVEAIENLRDKGFIIVAVEQVVGSIDLRSFRMEAGRDYAFVMGNEVDGVSDEVVERCDSVVEIEQCGVKKSLNVAVAAGIVLFTVKNL